jgi:hypothetical protein
VSQSSPVVLASGVITRAGDTLTIELIQPDSMPAMVRIVWPTKPTVTPPTPKALAAVAAAMLRWRRCRRNSPRRSGTAADRCRRAARCMKRGISG